MIAQLSAAAFDVLWEDLQLGAVPFPLERRIHGETFDERARIKQAVHADLAQRRLFRNNRPEPDLEDALTLLANPQTHIESMFMPDLENDDPINAVVVARGQFAIRAVQQHNQITIDRIRDTALAMSIVEVLPSNRAGQGRSVSLPADAVTNPHSLNPQARAQFRELETIMEKPVIRTGLLSVSRERTKLGGITWFDTERGRYANVDKNGWITVTPTDAPRLANQLNQFLSN